MALRLPKQDYHDIERVIELDFVRATEAAALNSLRWLGRGDKEAADAAASDAIRGMFDLMNICGEVVIGEGIKDNAPGIFKGEQLGTWYPGSPEFHIALDPIDGTTNISKGAPNSISCIAAASPEEGVKVALRDIPSFYMSKLAYGPRVIEYMKKRGDSLHLDMPIPEMLAIVAHAVNKRVQDVAVMMLDRPRHKEIVEQIRAAGASLRMIGDGDIAAAIAPSLPEADVDLYMGIGGSPEAVLGRRRSNASVAICNAECGRATKRNEKAWLPTAMKKISTACTRRTISRMGRTSFSARPASATARFLQGCERAAASRQLLIRFSCERRAKRYALFEPGTICR